MLADKYERARRLKQAIADRGFKSLKEASVRHHYKESTLTSHTNGTRAFDIETGYDYAKAFKVDPIWLMGLNEEAGAPVGIPADVVQRMVEGAMRELPLGATVEDYLRNVPLALHRRLERFLTDGEFPGTGDATTVPDIDAPPLAPTKPDARG